MIRTVALFLVCLVYSLWGQLPRAQSQNILSNGDFESGTSSWAFWTNGSGDFSTGTPAYAGSASAIVTLWSSGTNIQLRQSGMTVNPYTEYRLTFAARSNTGRDMFIQLMKDSDPWTQYGLGQTVDLGTSWQTFQIDFETEGFSGQTTDVRFRFWFADHAQADDIYYIDDVSLSELAPDTIAPDPPTLASPTNGATSQPPNPTLVWNTSVGAASYGLQVATDSTFSTTLVSETGLTSTSFGLGDLLDETTYYWRANATDPGGTSGWSAAWHFTVQIEPPAIPTLASPSNGATGVSSSPTLSWGSSTGATLYCLQVSLTSGFASTVVDDSVAAISYGITGLDDSTTYYWRVRAKNSAGSSAWSTVWYFQTSAPSANVLLNGGFEAGTGSWWSYFENGSGSFATGTPAGEGALSGIVSINTATSNMQLSQNGMMIEPNTDYRIAFKAFSNTGNDMRVYLHKNGEDYANYGLWEEVDLGTSWQTYQFDFTTTGFETATEDSRLRFWFVNLAEANDTYYVDSVFMCVVAEDTGGGIWVPTGTVVPVIALTPGRTYFFEDEAILFDGSSTFCSEGFSIAEYYWLVDGVYVSSSVAFSQRLSLGPGESSKSIDVNLSVKDNYGNWWESLTTIVVKRRPQTQFYLTDHLGTIRSTVRGGSVLVQDDFSNGLGNWENVLGGGWFVESGVLGNSIQWTADRILVHDTPGDFTSGIFKVDVMAGEVPQECASVVVRYQDNDNYYLIKPVSDRLKLYERLNGTLYQRTDVALPGGTIQDGEWYTLQVTADAGVLTVYWDGEYAGQWEDTSPWLQGKVGFYHDGPTGVSWQNVFVSTEFPGEVIAAEDFDPWGLVLEGRSEIASNADARYKYTGKERDAESGYDYFGARYYDARIGRWLSVDPKSGDDPGVSAFAYARCNPTAFLDPDGKYSIRPFTGIDGQLHFFFYREGYVGAMWANLIPGGSIYRLARQDPAIGIPSIPEMAEDLCGVRAVKYAFGNVVGSIFDRGSTAMTLIFDREISEAQAIEQEAFAILAMKGMLASGKPSLDLNGNLTSIDPSEGTETMYPSPEWLAKSGYSVTEGVEEIVRAIKAYWMNKNPELYQKFIEGVSNAERIRRQRLLHQRYDASQEAPPDATMVSPF